MVSNGVSRWSSLPLNSKTNYAKKLAWSNKNIHLFCQMKQFSKKLMLGWSANLATIFVRQIPSSATTWLMKSSGKCMMNSRRKLLMRKRVLPTRCPTNKRWPLVRNITMSISVPTIAKHSSSLLKRTFASILSKMAFVQTDASSTRFARSARRSAFCHAAMVPVSLRAAWLRLWILWLWLR